MLMVLCVCVCVFKQDPVPFVGKTLSRFFQKAEVENPWSH